MFFACSSPDSKDNSIVGVDRTGDVYTEVDKQPEFNGGREGLISYLGANIVYPEEAKLKGIEGKVMVNFVVD